jgi:hypothetical protein
MVMSVSIENDPWSITDEQGNIQAEGLAAATIRTVRAMQLGTVFDNAIIRQRAKRSAQNQRYVRERSIIRVRPTGGLHVLPLEAVAKSWWDPRTKSNIHRELLARGRKMQSIQDRDKWSPIFLTLDVASAVTSWSEQASIRNFLQRLRVWSKRQGWTIDYLWTTEVQKRYAIHYHIIVLGAGWIPDDHIKSWWTVGSYKFRRLGVQSTIGYVAKYAAKTTSSETSDTLVRDLLFSVAKLRHHGCSRRISDRSDRLPGWVSDVLDQRADKTAPQSFGVEESLDLAYITFSDAEVLTYRWSEIKWYLSTATVDELSGTPTRDMIVTGSGGETSVTS